MSELSPCESKLRNIHLHSIRVYGIPKAQPRPRAFVRRGTGRAGVYDAGTAEAWKGDVARAFAGLEGGRLNTPLCVTLTFFMPRPKGHYRPNGTLKPASPVCLHVQKPDSDNLAKAVLDSLTNIGVWIDDSQVCQLQIYKYWEVTNEAPPGCMIIIALIKEEVL